MTSLTRRSALILPLSAFVSGCSDLLPSQSNRTITGTVDHKGVFVGKNESSMKSQPASTRLVAVHHDGDVFVRDEVDRSRVFDGEKVVITEEFISDLRKEYNSIAFVVNVQLETRDPVNDLPAGNGIGYKAGRDQFNSLDVDEPVRLVVSKDGDSIESILSAP